MKNVKLTITFTLLCLGYVVVLSYLAGLLAGVGHGPISFASLIFASFPTLFFIPYDISLTSSPIPLYITSWTLFWPILGICLGQMRYKNIFWYSFLGLMLTHYLLGWWSVLQALPYDLPIFRKWMAYPTDLIPFMAVFCLIYVLGQCLMWGRFVTVTRKATL
jgi:hypothetical protein